MQIHSLYVKIDLDFENKKGIDFLYKTSYIGFHRYTFQDIATNAYNAYNTVLEAAQQSNVSFIKTILNSENNELTVEHNIYDGYGFVTNTEYKMTLSLTNELVISYFAKIKDLDDQIKQYSIMRAI